MDIFIGRGNNGSILQVIGTVPLAVIWKLYATPIVILGGALKFEANPAGTGVVIGTYIL
jgi:translation initiation factor 2B subunit (eIF-2B alpha/beta/delta family)